MSQQSVRDFFAPRSVSAASSSSPLSSFPFPFSSLHDESYNNNNCRDSEELKSSSRSPLKGSEGGSSSSRRRPREIIGSSQAASSQPRSSKRLRITVPEGRNLRPQSPAVSRFCAQLANASSLLKHSSSAKRGAGLQKIEEIASRDDLEQYETAAEPNIWGNIVLSLLFMMKQETKNAKSRGGKKPPATLAARANAFNSIISKFDAASNSNSDEHPNFKLKLAAGNVHKDVIEHVCNNIFDSRVYCHVGRSYVNILVRILRRYQGAMDSALYVKMIKSAFESPSPLKGAAAEILKTLLIHHDFCVPQGTEIMLVKCVAKWIRALLKGGASSSLAGSRGEMDTLQILSGLCNSHDGVSLAGQIRAACVPPFVAYALGPGCELPNNSSVKTCLFRCAVSVLRCLQVAGGSLPRGSLAPHDFSLAKVGELGRCFHDMDSWMHRGMQEFGTSCVGSSALYVWNTLLGPRQQAYWEFASEISLLCCNSPNEHESLSLLPAPSRPTKRMALVFSVLAHNPFCAASILEKAPERARLIVEDAVRCLRENFSLEVVRSQLTRDRRPPTMAALEFLWTLQTILPLSLASSQLENRLQHRNVWRNMLNVFEISIVPAMCHVIGMSSISADHPFVNFIAVILSALFSLKLVPLAPCSAFASSDEFWNFINLLLIEPTSLRISSVTPRDTMNLLSVLFSSVPFLKLDEIGKQRRTKLMEWTLKWLACLGEECAEYASCVRNSCVQLIVAMLCHKNIYSGHGQTPSHMLASSDSHETLMQRLESDFGVLRANKSLVRSAFKLCADPLPNVSFPRISHLETIEAFGPLGQLQKSAHAHLGARTLPCDDVFPLSTSIGTRAQSYGNKFRSGGQNMLPQHLRKQLAANLLSDIDLRGDSGFIVSLKAALRMLRKSSQSRSEGLCPVSFLQKRIPSLDADNMRANVENVAQDIATWMDECARAERASPYAAYFLLNRLVGVTFGMCSIEKNALGPSLRCLFDSFLSCGEMLLSGSVAFMASPQLVQQQPTLLECASQSQAACSQFDCLDSPKQASQPSSAGNSLRAEDFQHGKIAESHHFLGVIRRLSRIAFLAFDFRDNGICHERILELAEEAIKLYFERKCMPDHILECILNSTLPCYSYQVGCRGRSAVFEPTMKCLSLFFSYLDKNWGDDSRIRSAPVKASIRILHETLSSFHASKEKLNNADRIFVYVKQILACKPLLDYNIDEDTFPVLSLVLPWEHKAYLMHLFTPLVGICQSGVDEGCEAASDTLGRFPSTIIQCCLECDENTFLVAALLEAFPDGQQQIMFDVICNAAKRCCGCSLFVNMDRMCEALLDVDVEETEDCFEACESARSGVPVWFSSFRQLCFALAEMARFAPESLLKPVLVFFCEFADRAEYAPEMPELPDIFSFLKNLLESLARSLGYDAPESMLTASCEPVLLSWIHFFLDAGSDGRFHFPFNLFGIRDADGYVHRHSHRIFPAVLLAHTSKSAALLPSIFQKNLPEMLLDHLPGIIARRDFVELECKGSAKVVDIDKVCASVFKKSLAKSRQFKISCFCELLDVMACRKMSQASMKRLLLGWMSKRCASEMGAQKSIRSTLESLSCTIEVLIHLRNAIHLNTRPGAQDARLNQIKLILVEASSPDNFDQYQLKHVTRLLLSCAKVCRNEQEQNVYSILLKHVFVRSDDSAMFQHWRVAAETIRMFPKPWSLHLEASLSMIEDKIERHVSKNSTIIPSTLFSAFTDLVRQYSGRVAEGVFECEVWRKKSVAVCASDLCRLADIVGRSESEMHDLAFKENDEARAPGEGSVVCPRYLDALHLLDGSSREQHHEVIGQETSEIFKQSVAVILSLCSSDVPPAIRSESARCIGAIGLTDFPKRMCISKNRRFGVLKRPKSETKSPFETAMLQVRVALISFLASACISDPHCADDTLYTSCAFTSLKRFHGILLSDADGATSERLSPSVRRELCALFGDLSDACLNTLPKFTFGPSTFADLNHKVGLRVKRMMGRSFDEDADMWCMHLLGNHSVWVRCITYCMCKTASFVGDSYLRLCANFCVVSESFARQLFRCLVFCAIGNSKAGFNLARGRAEPGHLRASAEKLSCVLGQIISGPTVPMETKRLVIQTILFLRERHIAAVIGNRAPSGGKRKRGTSRTGHQPIMQNYISFYVSVSCIELARCALACDMPMAAILFAKQHSESVDVASSPDSAVCDQILLDAYSSIGESDLLHGVYHDGDVFGIENESNWDDDYNLGRLSHLDRTQRRLHSHFGNAEERAMCVSLRNLGLFHLLEAWRSVAGTGMQTDDRKMDDLLCEATWRNPSALRLAPRGNESSFNGCIQNCLKGIFDGDAASFGLSMHAASSRLVSVVGSEMATGEHSVRKESAFKKLHILSELQGAWHDLWGGGSGKRGLSERIIMRDARTKRTSRDFKDAERLMALRTALLHTGVRERGDFNASLAKHVWEIAKLSKRKGEWRVATNAISQLNAVLFSPNATVFESHFSPGFAKIKYTIEAARVLWGMGKRAHACHNMKGVIKVLEGKRENGEAKMECAGMLASCFCLAGQWLAILGSADSDAIRESFLEKSIQIGQEARSSDMGQYHFALAQYVDGLYQKLVARMKSDQWIKWTRVVDERRRQWAAKRDELYSAPKSARKSKAFRSKEEVLARLERECDEDKMRLEKVKGASNKLLMDSLRHYAKSLCFRDSGRDQRSATRAVFRIVALWFENEGVKDVNDLLHPLLLEKRGHAPPIPSLYFVVLLPQILSRVEAFSFEIIPGSHVSFFRSILGNFVVRLAKDHPLHALPHILHLRRVSSEKGGSTSKRSAAENILKTLAAREPLSSLVKDMSFVYACLSEIAKYKVSDKSPILDTRTVPITCSKSKSKKSFFEATRKLRQPAMLPVPSYAVRIRPNCDYFEKYGVGANNWRRKDGHHIIDGGFRKSAQLIPTGIHKPKRLRCKASDGRERSVMVKYDKLVRQDAVMEQLFALVNSLLQCNANAMERELRVRTYGVHPLSKDTGVIEWVDNALTLSAYIPSTHKKLHPSEFTYKKCIEEMQKAGKQKEDVVLMTFRTVCENFSPVMRHFFFERYTSPSRWLGSRLTYARSLAVNSMVGYVLGIGDRHAGNIMLDEETAELVHIDFGIAFEQGKTQRVPERVPFRLTRNMLDPLGTVGARKSDGVFVRTCEVALSVLRSNVDALMTILQVLVDETCRWDGAADRRPESSSSADAEAARLLIRVRQKLLGFEDPNGNALGVEGQVKRLIGEACADANLAPMWPGWSPFS